LKKKLKSKRITVRSCKIKFAASFAMNLYKGGRSMKIYSILNAYPNLDFDQPILYTYADDGSNKVYVVERTGKIKFFDNNADADTTHIFLDLGDKIDLSYVEKGLLGLAFHPDYKENGFFYVNYTTSGGTVISRYSLDTQNPDFADSLSEKILLTFSQPYKNHKGGQLEFGPDGYLYIATGDGGSGGDPHNNAQNLKKYLGKILRIDVDKATIGKSYGIPADNPFVGNKNGYLEEIYAYGFRNPWRFSFDKERNLLWAGDVGQDRREEIDIVENGKNYGWRIMEGNLEYSPSQTVNAEDLTPPVWDYGRSEGGCIIGGIVYYGSSSPDLRGEYIYGDYMSGRIWALRLGKNGKAENQELAKTDLEISSFGTDKSQELYILDFRGKIYKLAKK
jgi:glucose/arabinose dehydrogenase